MILVGTSGFAYRDWEGPFYPPGIPAADRLAFYAERFPVLEINFTYYRIPGPGQLGAMADRSGGRVVFTVKAHRAMTHEGTAGEGDYTSFLTALEPLADRGLLGCVLLQFPWSFRPGPGSRETLRALAARFRPLETTAEFRHGAWAAAETFRFLRDEGIGFCAVDEPRLAGLFPPVAAVTSPVGYLRLHGRNARKWWHHAEAHERYDYLYTRSQLAEWVPRLREMDHTARTTYVFANNHYEGKAARNAAALTELLREPAGKGSADDE